MLTDTRPYNKATHAVEQFPDTIVFYDGECGFCQGWVRFLMHRDTHRQLHFAPLQGTTAEALLPLEMRQRFDSVVFWQSGKICKYSSALVQMLWTLGSGWRVPAVLLWLIPFPLRDFGYGVVARSRYRLGKLTGACSLPSVEERQRLLN